MSGPRTVIVRGPFLVRRSDGGADSMSTGFDARAYLPRELYQAITDIRVRQPAFADGEADRRSRRRVLVPDGKLVILAADHPGRASLKIQDDPLAMADRHELLARILRVLSHPGIDGFMSTPEIGRASCTGRDERAAIEA